MQTAVRCQMRPTPAGVSQQRGVVPQVPLLRPLGTAARTFAVPKFFSVGGGNDQESEVPFVRPDVPPDYLSADDETLPRDNWKGAGKAVANSGADINRTAFSSALEQASFLTNQQEISRNSNRRSGRFGLGFLGL